MSLVDNGERTPPKLRYPEPETRAVSPQILFVRCFMADLNDADVRALAKASDINIPDDLVSEVRESLNGLLEALAAITEPDVADIQPLPIIVSATARKQEAP